MTFESRCNTDAEYMMRHVCFQGMPMNSQGKREQSLFKEKICLKTVEYLGQKLCKNNDYLARAAWMQQDKVSIHTAPRLV